MRKFFLIGILATLLIAIPLTVYILTTGRTNTQSGAAPSTVLGFNIPQEPAMVGTPVNIPVTVDPSGGGGSSSNQVSFIKLVMTYDGTKLQATSNYFTPDPKFSALEGPSNNCDSKTNICTISVTLTTGPDPSTAVSGLSNVGTLNFNPLVPTDPNSPTQLVFGSSSQALSIASTDKPAENVIAFNRLQPGLLTIVTAAATSPTPGSGGGSSGGGSTGGGSSGGGSSGGSSGGTTQSALTCSGLTADNTSSTSAPLTVLFTATGQDSGNITKVSYNYGDGTVQDVTSGGGIGTNSISVQASHIYKTNGTYTATAVLTDDSGNITSPSSCSQTITIGSASTGSGSTPAPTTATTTTAPTIPSTGPGQVFVGIGIAGILITAAGLFFAAGL